MFDAARFLQDRFTNPDGVIGLFQTYGMNCPSREAVRKWFERSSISAEWLPLLLALLELDAGEPVSLAQYLTVRRKSC
jgi:hypothetical protein